MRRNSTILNIILTALFLSPMIFSMESVLANTTSQHLRREGKCTSLLLGKNATIDGSVICTQANEGGYADFRLRYHPAVSHRPGDMRVVQLWDTYGKYYSENRSFWVRSGPILKIPEAGQTYAYFTAMFPFMNENQVAVGESTLFGVRKELFPSDSSDAKLSITDLSRIALERATTAREAIKIMASLMEEHGFDTHMPGMGEYFAVADKDEVWCFEFVPVGPNWKKNAGEPGVAWCAMRIPDEQFAVVANESIIGEVNLQDKNNVMASSNVMSLAAKYGWWDPKSGQPFRWDLAYTGKKANSFRTWRALSLVAPSQNLKPKADGYPNPIKPDKKLTITDVRKIHGDYFEGTEFDKTKGLSSGPFGSPERPRGTPNDIYSLGHIDAETVIINQCRSWLPDPIGGVMWVAMTGGNANIYVPFYAGMTRLPEAYTVGVYSKFSWDSAFWIFSLVSNWAQINYSHMINEIREVQTALENGELKNQSTIDEEAYRLYEQDPPISKEYLTGYCINNANKILEAWRELASLLIARYCPGSAFAPRAPDGWRQALEEKQK